MKTPEFLRALMSSPAYMNKDSAEYAMVERYLKILYPGTRDTDATGRMSSPAYDMTLQQFYDAQMEFDHQIAEAKQEAIAEMYADSDPDELPQQMDEDDLDQYIEIAEIIDVAVLMPLRGIENKKLYVYTLNMPDDDADAVLDNTKKTRIIYRWHAEAEENTCSDCAARDGEIYENEQDIPSIPVHPNCRCTITMDEIDATGRTIRSKPYTPKKKDTKEMKISDRGIEWLKHLEGFVKVDGKHVIYNDATGLPVPKGAPLPAGATIGYGHLIKPGEDFSNGLTEKEATELFQHDLQATYNTISKQIDHDVLATMPQHQYDALVALVFNIGPGSAAPENVNRGLYQSTIRKYINDNDFHSNIYPTQESAWKAFNNHGDLDDRRDAEWRLYQNRDYSGYR